MHNYIVPVHICDLIAKAVEDRNSKIARIDLILYSSAVTQHLSGNPHYCAGKSALEAYFKSAFKTCPEIIRMYLFRLGMVDIQHKYFHKLSKEDPGKFTSILKENIPSMHFTTPEEIANIVASMTIGMSATNGLLCDLTGGNSWN